jgi:gluconokinase
LASRSSHPPIIVVMGVSGSGKTTIAELLARRLSLRMLEGDSLHPRENIERMRAGVPLTDEDRRGWLDAIGEHIAAAAQQKRGLVVSCSALKRRYRDILRRHVPDVIFVYLRGDESTIGKRLKLRSGHFMPPALLDSQFEVLEPPDADEAAMSCDIAAAPGTLIESILQQLPSLIERFSGLLRNSPAGDS